MLFNSLQFIFFFPRMYEGLEERGVTYVDIYHPFIAHGEELYYGTSS